MLIIVSLNENQQLTCDIGFVDNKVLLGISYCYIRAMFQRKKFGPRKEKKKALVFL